MTAVTAATVVTVVPILTEVTVHQMTWRIEVIVLTAAIVLPLVTAPFPPYHCTSNTVR